MHHKEGWSKCLESFNFPVDDYWSPSSLKRSQINDEVGVSVGSLCDSMCVAMWKTLEFQIASGQSSLWTVDTLASCFHTPPLRRTFSSALLIHDCRFTGLDVGSIGFKRLSRIVIFNINITLMLYVWLGFKMKHVT